ncbi:MAG: response regulator [Polyangiaceae bacterium]
MSDLDCPALRGKRVLVVDDDADSREMLAMVLERSGAVVAIAETAAEALATFQTQHPDVLLLDLGLPDEDGFSLLKKLRELDPEGEEIPAIALTGYGSPEDRQQTRSGGFSAHLVKPVALSDMLESVAKVLQLPSRVPR